MKTTKNNWTINKSTQSLYWFASLDSKQNEIEDVIKVLKTVEKITKEDKNIKICQGKINFYIKESEKSTHPFGIKFVNFYEITKQLEEKDIQLKNLHIYDITLELSAYLSVYNSDRKIIKKWVDSVIEINIDNEKDDFYITLFNLSDVWLPQTWYSDNKIGSNDNIELAKLNLPILNILIRKIIHDLRVKCTVKHELSEKNKSLLNIKPDGIEFKNE